MKDEDLKTLCQLAGNSALPPALQAKASAALENYIDGLSGNGHAPAVPAKLPHGATGLLVRKFVDGVSPGIQFGSAEVHKATGIPKATASSALVALRAKGELVLTQQGCIGPNKKPNLYIRYIGGAAGKV